MKNYIMIILTLQAFCLNVGAQEKQKGRVVDVQTQEPLAGATIKVINPAKTFVTDSEGYFELNLPKGDYQLAIIYLSYHTKEQNLTIPFAGNMLISLQANENTLQEVNIVSTGYQTLPKERATGSFALVDSALLNKRVGSNILDRLKGGASGLLFDQRTGTSNGFNVRGRSTIFANTEPLIILDNFPFDGNINSINPDDIAHITILKDAAAASIWGVRASNGVIVLTTKTAKVNQPLVISFNGNLGVTDKPNLFSSNELGTEDYILLEEELYKKGAYTNALAVPRTYISPIVEILNNRDNGKISAIEATTLINAYKRGGDVRKEIEKYYYRNSIQQQYTLNFKGGGKHNKYFASVGYQKQLEDLVSNQNNRLTLNTQQTYYLLKNKLEVSNGINIAAAGSKTHNGNILNPNFIKPYTKLIDKDGHHLAVPRYKKQWLDTIAGGRLLNWDWKPLDELERNADTRSINNYVLDVGLKYNISTLDHFSIKYQFSKGGTAIDDLSAFESYYTRDYINQFSQPNYLTNEVIRPVPLGDILKKTLLEYQTHNIRAQLNIEKNFRDHHFNAIAGTELKDYNYQSNSYTLYGYDRHLGQVGNVNYGNQYKNFVTGGNSYIAGSPSQNGITDRYVSFFTNALYSFRNKYSVSASARRDESNLFGVKANQRSVPLWSVGVAWLLSAEKFMQFTWLDQLKLRSTFGYNGNVDKSVSAYVTAQTLSGSSNMYGAPFASIVNPPNPDLSWEKVGIFNIGFDFSLFKNKLTGSLEYYHKKGENIIGNSPLAPSSGVTLFRGNSADIKANGFDFVLNVVNITNNKFKWTTNFLLSSTKDVIVTYKTNTSPLSFHVGYPFNSLFSFRWAGLDPNNGSPLGYLNGKPSNDWGKIVNLDSIGKTSQYSGSAVPIGFGSVRNNLSYGSFSLSFNMVFKLGYYFRRPTVNYSSINSLSGTHTDYLKRWKQPGDELYTNIPSSVYPSNFARDTFYTNSQQLIEKADHIRLQDVQLNYRYSVKKGLFNSLNIYLNASNLGVVWAANKQKIDPEYLNLAGQRTLTIGFNTTF